MHPVTLSPLCHALRTGWDAWLLTGLLAVVLPMVACFHWRPLLERAVPETEAGARRYLYGSVILTEWALAGALALLARRHGLALGELGQNLVHALRLAGVTGALLGVLALLSVQNILQLRRTPAADLKGQLGGLGKFYPSGPVELVLWVSLSVTAGFCEELLYRGWLLHFLGRSTGSLWAGLVLSSVLFGLGHAYQGAKGILATGLFGFVLGLVYVFVGSLVPGQVFHAALDLVNGLLGAGVMARVRLAGPEDSR